jgi:CRISPR-associated exonuclease Cas4
MTDAIRFSNLNDFLFCPASIYFSNLIAEQVSDSYKTRSQILGKSAHQSIDEQSYSSSKNILQGVNCYCSHYRIYGKIDLYDIDKQILTERKRKIVEVFDGYVFQLYAEYFSLKEMGYDVKEIRLYSYIDNVIYKQLLPENNKKMLSKFEFTIDQMRHFDLSSFVQNDKEKCKFCIYEPACDRSLL